MLYKKITKCRSCNQKTLKPILDLGKQELVYFTDKDNNEGTRSDKIPLQLVKCTNGNCHLVQLQHSVDRDTLFRNYYYKSGINQTMRDELKDIVQKAVKMARPKYGDVVIDIGANDGTLLSNYSKDFFKIAYEPSTNLIDQLIKQSSRVVNGYFKRSPKDSTTKAKIITAIAMFYDLDNPNEFLHDVKESLADDGVFIIQMNYLETMLKNNAFDNICHEHTCYYNLHSMIQLLNRNQLEIFHVEVNNINGGSIRLYIKHMGCKRKSFWLRDSLFKYLVDEESLYTIKLQEFAQRIAKIKLDVRQLLHHLVFTQQRTVYGYGASTRGAVLLQYFDLLDDGFIKKIADRNPEKWGTKYLGKIPVVSELQMRIDNPDALFVLPWYFEKEFISREMKEYLSRGEGTMIFPLPELHEIRPLPQQQPQSASFCPRRRTNNC